MTRFALFLSSYAPLLAICAIRFTDPFLVAACVGATILGVLLALWVLLAHARDTAAAPLPIEAAEDVGDLATTYLLTYLLPFIAIAQPSARDLAAYVLAFVVFALVYVRSDMQQVNPLLYAFGRRITKVTTAQKRTLYAISKHRVIPGEICGVELTSGVFLVTKESAA